ncbi:hypothetical protein IQ255_13990 [Pleurocapsales cyanobacterium LEGE 10410]|nr:hypothetical protein [Pleurocapsales cyanobacterium LEGE 10410]
MLPSTLLTTSFSGAALAQPTVSKKTDSKYINSLLPEARRIKREYGIPLDITIAIAQARS